MDLKTMAMRARAASYALMTMGEKQKNDVLLAMADALIKNTPAILAANEEDLAAAREKGEREGIRLYEFLREPLEERFGRAWYAELLDVAAALRREGYLDDK